MTNKLGGNLRSIRGRRNAGRRRGRAGLCWCILATGSLAAGCIPGVINPQFESRFFGNVFPVAPGASPFVLVEVINQTPFDVTFFLTTESPAGGGTEDLQTTPLLPRQSKVVACPVTRLALGVPGDPDSPAIRVFTNPAAGAFVEIPFVDPATGESRDPLTEGTSFLCGDTVIFLVSLDPTQPGRVAVTVGRIDGASQLGPFSGPATFDNLLDVATIVPADSP